MFTKAAMLGCLGLMTMSGAAVGQPYGIETRVPNTSLLIDTLPPTTVGAMQFQQAFGITFSLPVFLTESPDNSGRIFVLELDGRVISFLKSDPAGTRTTYLDITQNVQTVFERGCLGLAFDVDFATTGEFYVFYSVDNAALGGNDRDRLSRFTAATPSAATVNANTEEIILEVDRQAGNHHGGWIGFGGDGMLFVTFGDGGGAEDQFGNGQNLTTLLGDIIRIDVNSPPDAGLAYHIPTDNPFYLGGPQANTRKEIFAWGVRNPWRCFIDPLTNYFYVGDVGQYQWEEVSIATPGANLGWNVMEGTHCFSPASDCNMAGKKFPIAEYDHTLGNAITGGAVYYGTDVPELYGKYLYSDSGSGRLWALEFDGQSLTLEPQQVIGQTSRPIAGYGTDKTGEVYFLDLVSGEALVVRPMTVTPGETFPTRLSEIPELLMAGLDVDQTDLGIIPYEPSAKLWSDGAHKTRYIALPGSTQFTYADFDGYAVPDNALIIKNFMLPLDERNPEGSLQRVETRLLYFHDSEWRGFSYRWNEDNTDAHLLPPGRAKRQFNIIDENGDTFPYTWTYPGRNDCFRCHTNAAGNLLGLNTAQLNFDFHYPDSGVTDNQLRTFDHIGLFTAALPAAPATLPKMPDYHDTNASIQDRGRAYLASNCAQCHRPGGGTPAQMDFRWQNTNQEINAIGEVPFFGNFGIPNAREIYPGIPEQSVVPERMGTLGGHRMPPLATSRVDEEGLAVIEAWIDSLPVPVEASTGWSAH